MKSATPVSYKPNIINVTSRATPADAQCILMAMAGLASDLIAERTGLSKGKISYRLRAANIRLSDYRNGHNAIAKRVVRNCGDMKQDFLQELKDRTRLLSEKMLHTHSAEEFQVLRRAA